MKTPKPMISPSANKRLVSALRGVKREKGIWNIRETARRLGVNQKYVHDNLIHGIEPSNPDIRAKLFQIKPRKPRSPFACLPKWFERTTGALQFFGTKRQQIKVMSRNTKRPDEDKHEYEHV